jgi:hypothetical protein
MKIAPRLSSGDRRIPGYSGLPPELRRIIDRLARKERCSRSWVIEQIILDWAGISVDYVTIQKEKAKIGEEKAQLNAKSKEMRVS